MSLKNRTTKILQSFIVSLLFIAFGLTFRNDTLPLSFLILFILTMDLLVSGYLITIDNITRWLFIFFIIASLSVYNNLLWDVNPVFYNSETICVKNFKQLLMFFLMILHFIVLRNILKNYNTEKIQKLVNFFVFVSLLVSLYSIYQFFGFLYNLPFTDILRISKSYSITRGVELSSWIGLPRARAFMPEPSFWGTFLLIPFSLILPVAFEKKQITTRFFLVVFVIAQFLTFSRSSWFGFIFVFICFILYKLVYEKKIFRTIAIVFTMVCLIFILLMYFIPDREVLFQRLSAFSDLSAIERFRTQKMAFQAFLKNPILGIGFGNTPFFINSQVTHNLYLQLLLETGVVGFSVFVFFLFKIWNKLKVFEKRIKFSGEERKWGDLLLALKLSYISILFIWMNLPGYNFSYTWFLLALIAVLPNIYQNTKFKEKKI